jgi:hypothetical protein
MTECFLTEELDKKEKPDPQRESGFSGEKREEIKQYLISTFRASSKQNNRLLL